MAVKFGFRELDERIISSSGTEIWQTFFFKGPENKYFRLAGHMVSVTTTHYASVPQKLRTVPMRGHDCVYKTCGH